MPANEKPIDISLSKLPKCLFVIPIPIVVDVPLITAVAICKSPYMLIIGWKRLLEDLIRREGPFLETDCVPIAGLAILSWPLAVGGAVIAVIISSFTLALYSTMVIHQEDSVKFGLAYIVAMILLFDEYTNDMLYLKEGSCFPRPRYRENMINSDGLDRMDSIGNDSKNMTENIRSSRLVSQRSKTLKQAIQQYTPVQVYIGKFKQIPTRFIKIIAVCGRSPEAAASNDPKYEHIDISEKQKVLNECSEVENWLRKKKQLQDSLPKHVDPVLLLSDIKNKSETLDRLCRPIMTKPKPTPPKPATPEAPASHAPAQSDAALAHTTPLRRGPSNEYKAFTPCNCVCSYCQAHFWYKERLTT